MMRALIGSTVSFPNLAEMVLGLVVESPWLVVLGDFNIHTETAVAGVDQDLMTSIATMGLSQMVSTPTHDEGHTLDLAFSTRVDADDQGEKEPTAVPLSWTNHYMVVFRLTGM